MPPPNQRIREIAALALLCAIAYLPTLSIPLIQDDYPNISMAQHFGTVAGLPELLQLPAFRLRATGFWWTLTLWNAFKLTVLPYHLASLLLHIMDTGLVYGLVTAWIGNRKAAWWSAAFFAVHEGHQEAVMWFSAVNEPLMFLFGVASLLCWLHRTRASQIASFILFFLALISKESAVVFLPLLFLVSPRAEWRRTLVRLLPFAALTALAVLFVMTAQSSSFRFADGSFSVHAPFWITWTRSFSRLLWVWGWLACAVLLFVKPPATLRAWAVPPLLWIGVALLPYSFNTYSTQIPSRQTYVASAGLAMLVGIAVAGLRLSSGLVSAIAAAILIYNVGWLWIKKRPQFLDRAEPTEHLIRFAREHPGPIWIDCFPHREQIVAEEALRLALGRDRSTLVWTREDAARTAAVEFCDAGPVESPKPRTFPRYPVF